MWDKSKKKKRRGKKNGAWNIVSSWLLQRKSVDKVSIIRKSFNTGIFAYKLRLLTSVAQKYKIKSKKNVTAELSKRLGNNTPRNKVTRNSKTGHYYTNKKCDRDKAALALSSKEHVKLLSLSHEYRAHDRTPSHDSTRQINSAHKLISLECSR